MTANTPASRKAKGRNLQNEVADYIRMAFGCQNTDVKPAVMGESGIDIHLSQAMQNRFPVAIECKNRESMNIWSAMSQAEHNALKAGLAPALVFKRARSDVYVCVKFSDFMIWMSRLDGRHTGPISSNTSEGEIA